MAAIRSYQAGESRAADGQHIPTLYVRTLPTHTRVANGWKIGRSGKALGTCQRCGNCQQREPEKAAAARTQQHLARDLEWADSSAGVRARPERRGRRVASNVQTRVSEANPPARAGARCLEEKDPQGLAPSLLEDTMLDRRRVSVEVDEAHRRIVQCGQPRQLLEHRTTGRNDLMLDLEVQVKLLRCERHHQRMAHLTIPHNDMPLTQLHRTQTAAVPSGVNQRSFHQEAPRLLVRLPNTHKPPAAHPQLAQITGADCRLRTTDIRDSLHHLEHHLPPSARPLKTGADRGGDDLMALRERGCHPVRLLSTRGRRRGRRPVEPPHRQSAHLAQARMRGQRRSRFLKGSPSTSHRSWRLTINPVKALGPKPRPHASHQESRRAHSTADAAAIPTEAPASAASRTMAVRATRVEDLVVALSPEAGHLPSHQGHRRFRDIADGVVLRVGPRSSTTHPTTALGVMRTAARDLVWVAASRRAGRDRSRREVRGMGDRAGRPSAEGC